MSFRVRIAPGVRIGVSSRGVRASVGPRIARVHVGAGRTRISTGLGPFTYSTALGGSSYHHSSASRGGGSRRGSGYSGYANAYSVTPTQAAKINEAQAIQATLDRLTKAHHQTFPPAARVIANRPTVPSQKTLDKQHVAAALAPLGAFAFSARRAAKAAALQASAQNKAELEAEADRLQAQVQADLDQDWADLQANRPEMVIEVVTDAYGDNEAKAVVVGVEGSTMTVVMLAPDLSVIPTRDWSRTAAGNLSVKNMLVRDRLSYYFDTIMSNAVATVAEGFASAPAITAIQLVVVRQTDARSGAGVECIGAGLVDRQKLAAQSMASTPFSIMQAACGSWANNVDAKLQMKAMDLRAEPDIAALLQHFEKIEDDGPAKTSVRTVQPHYEVTSVQPTPVAAPAPAAAPAPSPVPEPEHVPAAAEQPTAVEPSPVPQPAAPAPVAPVASAPTPSNPLPTPDFHPGQGFTLALIAASVAVVGSVLLIVGTTSADRNWVGALGLFPFVLTSAVLSVIAIVRSAIGIRRTPQGVTNGRSVAGVFGGIGAFILPGFCLVVAAIIVAAAKG